MSRSGNTINKALVFTQRPCLTDEEILANRAKRQKVKEFGKEKQSSDVEVTSEKRGRGRPPGSKNKRTLEREAAQVSNAVTAPEKV